MLKIVEIFLEELCGYIRKQNNWPLTTKKKRNANDLIELSYLSRIYELISFRNERTGWIELIWEWQFEIGVRNKTGIDLRIWNEKTVFCLVKLEQNLQIVYAKKLFLGLIT